MTSAIWKITDRPWRTILAPIFTSRLRSVVIDQCLIASGGGFEYGHGSGFGYHHSYYYPPRYYYGYDYCNYYNDWCH
jgi:hypothetical protein